MLERLRIGDGVPDVPVSHSSASHMSKLTYMRCSSSTVQPMLFANSKTSLCNHETGYGLNWWPAPTPFSSLISADCIQILKLAVLQRDVRRSVRKENLYQAPVVCI